MCTLSLSGHTGWWEGSVGKPEELMTECESWNPTVEEEN